MPRVVDKTVFWRAVFQHFGGKMPETITRQEIAVVCENNKDVSWPHWLTNDPTVRKSKATYYTTGAEESGFAAAKVRERHSEDIEPEPEIVGDETAGEDVAPTTADLPVVGGSLSLIPSKKAGYVPFGHYPSLKKIIQSQMFFPVYVTGLSGNGKTEMVMQICADLKRECVRVNITAETDEDDLLGGFRLVDGETVWHNGPVVTAMERGAVCLLDEVDLGTNKLMCLQPVLEGKAIFLKKINKIIYPKSGFNVIATANTKGQGSSDGKFVGTNVQNEAFLERFAITMEQEYPSERHEVQILINIFEQAMEVQGSTVDSSREMLSKDFIRKLVSWAKQVRDNFSQGLVTEIISTRRLIHIMQSYVIFDFDRKESVQKCLARFEHEVSALFFDFYSKIDDNIGERLRAQATAGDIGNASKPKSGASITATEDDQWSDLLSKASKKVGGHKRSGP